MSKKMLKRSLALGALMAFVITGSAMAGDFNVYTINGDKTISDETIADKQTSNGNDYVIVYKSGNLTIDNCHFENLKKINDENDTNDKNKYGSVISDASGSKDKIIIKNSWFKENEHINAYKPYAILYLSTATDIENCHFIQNKTTSMGGALKLHKSVEYNITNTEFVKNEASEGAAALLNANTTLTLKGKNTFDGNTATSKGGAFNVQNGNNTINFEGECEFINNVAGVAGGAIYVYSTGNEVLNFKGSAIFKNNKANGVANDIHNDGIVDIYKGADVTLNGGMTGSGVVNVNGTLQLGGAIEANQVTFGADSKLVLLGEGDQFTDVYAVNGAGSNAKLTVTQGAELEVEGIKENTYNVAKDFDNITEAKEKFDVTNLNALMQGEWSATEENGLQLEVTAKDAEQIANDLGVSEATGDFLSNLAKDAGNVGEDVKENDGSAKGKLVGLANAAAMSENPVVIKAAEALQKMAEAGGNSATAANVVTNVTGVTNQRLSLTNGNHGGNKGGHGVGLLEEGSGAAIWAQYVHGKDEVEGMHSDAGESSYEGQYNGIVMGVDFKKVGKFQSGIAFNYGEGDTNSVGTTSPTRSDYDFWGIGYYGNIRNADSNVIFDIGYAKTDSDVTTNALGYTFEASPETTTWTAGVKVEKLYQNNNVEIVPYTGLRYMSIDPDDYSTKCGALRYDMERQDILLLPLGVSIKQEIVNPNGWVVTPKFDLSYIWAFGDTDSTMETNTVFGTDNRPIGYDVMDEGSWMGLVGVEAAMDDWTFGVSYSYQKGDHSESKKFYVDAKYSF